MNIITIKHALLDILRMLAIPAKIVFALGIILGFIALCDWISEWIMSL